MHILLPTDVFPPRCGGAGWSAHALALALQARGHNVSAIVPQQGREREETAPTLGVPTLRFGYGAPNIPFIKNYFRQERLWPRFADAIASAAVSGAPTVIHAQHTQAAAAGALAKERVGAPLVVTVRDHWPWDYFATGLHGDRVPYARQDAASLATDLMARMGPLRGLAGLPAIPYMLGHLRRRQALLQRADAVIAVSRYIAGRLGGIVASERIHIIPNIVDLAAIDATIAAPSQVAIPSLPYLLFAGKLERNKGAHLLPPIFAALGRERPELLERVQIVFCDGGSLQPQLVSELAALGVRAAFLGGIAHDDVLRLMARAVALVFPSLWGEPLSRLWLEAAACGAAIIAMPTGGIADVVSDDVTGLIARGDAQFAAAIIRLVERPDVGLRLRRGARALAERRFATDAVAKIYDKLYVDLLY